MTAISKKVKNNFSRTVKSNTGQDVLVVVLCFATGLVSSRAVWCDIPLAAVSVVLAFCCDDILCRYSLIAGSMISCGVLSFGEKGYIAVFLAGAVFLAVDNILQKRKYALAAAAAIVTAGKFFLAYHGMSAGYRFLALLEGCVVYVGALTAQSGLAVIKNGADSRSFTDIACGFIALAAFALAATGADSIIMYTGLAFGLGLGWFYISGGCVVAAMVSYGVAVTVCLDKAGFAHLFVALLAVWVSGCFFAEKISLFIYPAGILTAAVMNVMFIPRLNSFALTGSTVGALVIYSLLPHLPFAKIQSDKADFARGRDWRLLMLNLKKLENSLSFLAGSVIDISRLKEKNNSIQPLEDLVAEDVCRNCEKNTYCWQEKYSFTRQQFKEYSRKMNWATENRFSVGFCTQCINIEGIIKSFEENSRLLLSKKYIIQSQKNNQKLLQNAFLAISGAVGDLIYQNQRSYLINTTITMETDRFLYELGVGHSYCLCSQNPDQATFAVLSPVDDKDLYRIKNRLEHLYGVKFSDPHAEKQGTEIIYIFTARPLYSYDIAVDSSRYKNVNGDNREIFVCNGMVYAVLSDGMGTGALAAAESRTVTAMAKSLITTGISMKNVVDIINLAMNLKGGGENSASVDILEINLSDGSATITKAGAGVSIVLDRQGVTRHYRDSLPLGILKDIKPVECKFRLTAGDTVILMSDGAGVVSNTIKDMYNAPLSRIADAIIAENKTCDDKTVIVLRLKINI